MLKNWCLIVSLCVPTVTCPWSFSAWAPSSFSMPNLGISTWFCNARDKVKEPYNAQPSWNNAQVWTLLGAGALFGGLTLHRVHAHWKRKSDKIQLDAAIMSARLDGALKERDRAQIGLTDANGKLAAEQRDHKNVVETLKTALQAKKEANEKIVRLEEELDGAKKYYCSVLGCSTLVSPLLCKKHFQEQTAKPQ